MENKLEEFEKLQRKLKEIKSKPKKEQYNLLIDKLYKNTYKLIKCINSLKIDNIEYEHKNTIGKFKIFIFLLKKNNHIKMDSDNKYYVYSSINHEHFKKQNDIKIGMKSLIEKIYFELSLEESLFFKYVSARPFRENGIKCKPMGIIKINPDFFIKNIEVVLNE